VTVVLAIEIKGYSYLQVDTVQVPPQAQNFRYYQLPRLDSNKVNHLTEITSTKLYVQIKYLKDGVEFPYSEQKIEVFLTPRNIIRWIVPDITKGSGSLPLFNHIAAWVTPNNNAVKVMLRSAKDCHPQKALMGYPLRDNPDVVRSQV